MKNNNEAGPEKTGPGNITIEDLAELQKQMTNNVPAAHTFSSLSTEEVMRDRSSAYKFINFDNPPYAEDTFKTTE